MSRVDLFWKEFLTKILYKTYKNLLNNSEINEILDFLIQNMYTIDPLNLYKNVLYNISYFKINRYTILYRIKFMSGDYRNIINNPTIVEYKINELDNYINKYCIFLNHFTETYINKNLKIENIENAFESILKHDDIRIIYDIPNLIETVSVQYKYNNFISTITLSEFIYMIVFNQDIISSSPMNDILIKNIKSDINYKTIIEYMEFLKLQYTEGIPLNYVRSSSIFI